VSTHVVRPAKPRLAAIGGSGDTLSQGVDLTRSTDYGTPVHQRSTKEQKTGGRTIPDGTQIFALADRLRGTPREVLETI
jgi:hypothetical protein